MKTIDFRKDAVYKAKPAPQIIEIPEMLFVMVDGQGAPESSDQAETEFQKAMQILFGITYSIKFWDKKHDPPKDYAKFTVPPIEGLWWTKSGKNFDSKQPDDWLWTVMLRLPDFVSTAYFDTVVNDLIKNKQTDIYKKARLEQYNEGLAVQIMHIGPYDQEQADIDAMHTFARDNGYALHGKHHELYFGDPRRTKPENLRTILRQPIMKT